MFIENVKFSEIDVNDPFFASLRQDYPEFTEWFRRKGNELAYVSSDQKTGNINGFLYLKIETELLDDMSPQFNKARRIKLGTFKIDAHGTRLGEKFVKIFCDVAREEQVEEVYVTIFDKHQGLINLLKTFGFKKEAVKNKPTPCGFEGVYLKKFNWRSNHV